MAGDVPTAAGSVTSGSRGVAGRKEVRVVTIYRTVQGRAVEHTRWAAVLLGPGASVAVAVGVDTLILGFCVHDIRTRVVVCERGSNRARRLSEAQVDWISRGHERGVGWRHCERLRGKRVGKAGC